MAHEGSSRDGSPVPCRHPTRMSALGTQGLTLPAGARGGRGCIKLLTGRIITPAVSMHVK